MSRTICVNPRDLNAYSYSEEYWTDIILIYLLILWIMPKTEVWHCLHILPFFWAVCAPGSGNTDAVYGEDFSIPGLNILKKNASELGDVC